MPRQKRSPEQRLQDAKQKMSRGEPLTPGDLAILAGVGRATVDYWLTQGLPNPAVRGEHRPITHAHDVSGVRQIPATEIAWILEVRRTIRRAPRTVKPRKSGSSSNG